MGGPPCQLATTVLGEALCSGDEFVLLVAEH